MKFNYGMFLGVTIVCIAKVSSLAASTHELSIEDGAVVAADSENGSSGHQTPLNERSSISVTTVHENGSIADASSRSSLTDSARIQGRDHSYWVRSWGLLCRKAGLDGQVESVGGDVLTKIGQNGDQRDLIYKLKKSLDNVHQGDARLKRARADSMVIFAQQGLSLKRQQEPPTGEQHEQKDKENVQEALQVLIKILSVQNQALSKQAEEHKRLVDLKAQELMIKVQELEAANRDREEDLRMAAHDRRCRYIWSTLALFSATGNVVLAALLAT